jgi:hypothetical protein
MVEKDCKRLFFVCFLSKGENMVFFVGVGLVYMDMVLGYEIWVLYTAFFFWLFAILITFSIFSSLIKSANILSTYLTQSSIVRRKLKLTICTFSSA